MPKCQAVDGENPTTDLTTFVNTAEQSSDIRQFKLITDHKEVGQVWVMQAKRNKGAPGEGTEGHSVLGVLIEDVSYLGFRITNDISDEAADYRLFSADENGVLQAKGLVWKITAKVDKKSDRPVTTLYIRLDVTELNVKTDLVKSQSLADTTEPKAEADSSKPLDCADVAQSKEEADSANSQLRVPEEYLYYVANQKKVVERAVPGKGMLSSRQPVFGIYQRRFAEQSEDTALTVKSVGSTSKASSSENSKTDTATANHSDVVESERINGSGDAVKPLESEHNVSESKMSGIFGVDNDNEGIKSVKKIFKNQLNR